MNPVLAQLYGTGMDKTASEEEEYIDLNQISGADLLAGLQDGTIELPEAGGEAEIEKEAEEEDQIDLTQISGSDLLSMLEELEENNGEEVIEKMAADGSLEYWDTAGRIMAHAYASEMNKVANESEDGELPDNIEVNLDEITGQDLMGLMEAGYEFE